MARQCGTPSRLGQWRLWLLLVVLLGIGGCGKTGQITGTVKYKGKLLPTGRVAFFNSSDRNVGSASINSDGTYSATVPSGALKIAIITPPATTLKTLPTKKKKDVMERIKVMKKGAFDPLSEENADLIPDKVISVPARFADPTTSGLTLEVLGGPQSFDIDLPAS